ncbi:MAG: alpha/beta hydrolase [Alistipes sp.]|nr:alpha/beta hydrolase [Alistipes sp.]
MKKIFALLVLMAGVTFSASAQKTLSFEGADEIVRLWDNTTAKYSNYETKDEQWRNEKKSSIKHTSSCEVYIFKAAAEKNTGIGVVIFPGGGFLSVGSGTSTAKWYASQGITAAFVKYRLPNGGHNKATLEDAIGAVRYLRTRTDLGVDPAKVGVTGSSAGGHIAAWVSNTMADEEKPAFAIPLYPSITRTEFYSTKPCNYALMGRNYCYQDAVDMSVQNMVTPNTPPTLLLLCDDDRTVPSHSSATYYEALIRHGVKASMHIFPSGGHGMKKNDEERCKIILDWLDWLGLTKK